MGYGAWIDTVTVSCCGKLWPFIRYRDSNSFDFNGAHATYVFAVRTAVLGDLNEKLFGVENITKETIEKYFRSYVGPRTWKEESEEDILNNFGWYSSFYFGNLGYSGSGVHFDKYVNRLWRSVNRPIDVEKFAELVMRDKEDLVHYFKQLKDETLSNEERVKALRILEDIVDNFPTRGTDLVGGAKSYEGFVRKLYAKPSTKPKKTPTKVYGVKYHLFCKDGSICPTAYYVASSRNRNFMYYSRDPRYPYKTKASAKRMLKRLRRFVTDLASAEIIEAPVS